MLSADVGLPSQPPLLKDATALVSTKKQEPENGVG